MASIESPPTTFDVPRGPRVLYLHGRGDQPTDPPGDLVHRINWRFPLFAPDLDQSWHSQRFGLRLADVDNWMGGTTLAIGHSFGGWLLLAAGAARLNAGCSVPKMLLLGTVLGISVGRKRGRAVTFSAPPGMATVHRALSLVSGRDSALFAANDLEFIHGESDEQCPFEPIRGLRERYPVRIVPGGHRLDHPTAIKVVEEKLKAYRDQRLPVI